MFLRVKGKEERKHENRERLGGDYSNTRYKLCLNENSPQSTKAIAAEMSCGVSRSLVLLIKIKIIHEVATNNNDYDNNNNFFVFIV